MSTELVVRKKGVCDYLETYQAMMAFTDGRHSSTVDEVWCLQHRPVYTLGLRGGRQHVISAGTIPVVATDRGGQVTYHGPGQLIVYLLIDLIRKNLGVRAFIQSLEQTVMELLKNYGVKGRQRPGAPGVYVDGKKIMALGIRIRRGCSYHGIAINVDMDTTAYEGIHACGDPQLEITQLKEFAPKVTVNQVRETFLRCLYQKMDCHQSTMIKQSPSQQVA